MNKTWFNITPAAEGSTEAEISIYDAIGGYEINAKDFADQLKALDAETIHLRINSPGGSVIDGNAIFNALKRHSAKVVTHIDGLAASMASVIAMAGDEVRMADNALIMIHNPWTVSMGDADDLRADADLLDKMSAAITSAYSRSQYSAEELKDLMDAETWMTAQEAFDAGFIDQIETGLRAAAELTATAAIGGIEVPAAKQIAALTKQIEALQRGNAELFAKVESESVISVNIGKELAEARAEIEAAEIAAGEFESVIGGLEGNLANAKAEIEAKDAEIEQAKIVTDEAVAQKAAEITQSNTHAAVTEDDDTDSKLSSDDFWAEYKRVGDEKGLDAKNEWYAANKHRKL